jgi:hypothetical protein
MLKILGNNHSRSQLNVSNRNQGQRIKKPHVSQAVDKSKNEVGITIINNKLG